MNKAYRYLSVSSALFLVTSCEGRFAVSPPQNLQQGAGKINVLFQIRNHSFEPDQSIPINPLSVVPLGFDQEFINDHYLNKGTEYFSVNAGYSMRGENITFLLENKGSSDLVIDDIKIDFSDPNVLLARESFPITIAPRRSYEISLAGNCADVDWDSNNLVLKLSIASNDELSPDFNSDIIVNCGY